MWRGLRRTQEEQIEGQLSLWLRQRPHGGATLGKSVLPAGRCWSLQGDWAPPGLPVGEESACRRGEPGSFLGSGRCPGEGNDTPLQILAWKNPMEGEAWRATVPGVASVSGAGRHRRGRAEESTANAKKTLLCLRQSPAVAPYWQRLALWKSLSRVRLTVIPWTIQSVEFSRPGSWSR